MTEEISKTKLEKLFEIKRKDTSDKELEREYNSFTNSIIGISNDADGYLNQDIEEFIEGVSFKKNGRYNL